MKVAIVGCGITALAAAFTIEKARRDGAPVDYTVLGAGGRAGGIVRVVRAGGYVIDAGPDGFVASKPSAAAMCRELGLGDQLVETIAAHRRTYMVHGRRLRRMPQGLFLVAPTRLGPIVRSPLISPEGQARIFEDLSIAPRPEAEGDESITQFVTRRFGAEWSALMGGSMLAGIYAGDPDELSVRATFPQLVALEREHGSLIRGALALRTRAPKRAPGAPPCSAFLSLRGGLDGLTGALHARLPHERVRLDADVRAIERTANGLRIRCADGTTVEADQVLLAVPAFVAARLLEPLEPDVARMLAGLQYVSTASVYMGYPTANVARRLDATGFLAPHGTGLRMSASTWLSAKWPGRAPEGRALFRVFYGSARDPSAHTLDDATLLAMAVRELTPLVGLSGSPEVTHVQRHLDASPQPRVGHVARMQAVDARLAQRGDIAVLGGGYRGVGLPDSISDGVRQAGLVLARALHSA